MNEGNRKRVVDLGKYVTSLGKENPPADTVINSLLNVISRCVIIMQDCHFRPEANE